MHRGAHNGAQTENAKKIRVKFFDQVNQIKSTIQRIQTDTPSVILRKRPRFPTELDPTELDHICYMLTGLTRLIFHCALAMKSPFTSLTAHYAGQRKM